VHHGLQAAADDFVRHCQAACQSLDVPLHLARVDARHAPGESPEDAARKARYTALAQLAKSLHLKTVLLAQHADDQVETMLLALSRGAGLPGLARCPCTSSVTASASSGRCSASPASPSASGLPGRAFLTSTTHECGRCFYPQSYRHDILPALEKTFPRFRETFARSARHAAQAQELLAAAGGRGMAAVGNPPVIECVAPTHATASRHLLRHWCATCTKPPPARRATPAPAPRDGRAGQGFRTAEKSFPEPAICHDEYGLRVKAASAFMGSSM